MFLICNFETADIKIEIADIPPAKSWISRLNINDSWNANVWPISAIDTNIARKEKCRAILIQSINGFNETFPEFKIPFELTNDYQFTNKDLNLLHRFFTTGTSHRRWYYHQDVFDIENLSIWHGLLTPINTAIHNLQLFYSTDAKLASTGSEFINVSANNISRYPHPIGDWKYLDYDLEYDVFIQHEICGKDTFQAYLDGDSCIHADVMSQWTSYYNWFYIDVNGSRNASMRKQDFINWLDGGRKLNTAWQYMPLGKVVGAIDTKNLGILKGLTLE